jgi:hypothetical protein
MEGKIDGTPVKGLWRVMFISGLLTAGLLGSACSQGGDALAPVSPSPLPQHRLTLTGRVVSMTDAGTQPLAAAVAEAIAVDGKATIGMAGTRPLRSSASTSETGGFVLELDPGSWMVRIVKPGYLEASTRLELSADVSANFELQRSGDSQDATR